MLKLITGAEGPAHTSLGRCPRLVWAGPSALYFRVGASEGALNMMRVPAHAHSFVYDNQNACKEQAEAPRSTAFGPFS
jgi:hypothetical protein